MNGNFWDKFWQDYYFNDSAIWQYYPYLKKYINVRPGQKVLEIGFGSGWLARYLFTTGCDYYGIDTSIQAVKNFGDTPGQVRIGSALDIPYPDNYFDQVYSIGCLHHTGDMWKCAGEIRRVLKPGGRATVMIYNKNSFRYRFWLPVYHPYLKLIRTLFPAATYNFPSKYKEFVRWAYDEKGKLFPDITEFITRKQAAELFGEFSKLTITTENFDRYGLPENRLFNLGIKREWLLKTPLPRILGLELYIKAVK